MLGRKKKVAPPTAPPPPPPTPGVRVRLIPGGTLYATFKPRQGDYCAPLSADAAFDSKEARIVLGRNDPYMSITSFSVTTAADARVWADLFTRVAEIFDSRERTT